MARYYWYFEKRLNRLKQLWHDFWTFQWLDKLTEWILKTWVVRTAKKFLYSLCRFLKFTLLWMFRFSFGFIKFTFGSKLGYFLLFFFFLSAIEHNLWWNYLVGLVYDYTGYTLTIPKFLHIESRLWDLRAPDLWLQYIFIEKLDDIKELIFQEHHENRFFGSFSLLFSHVLNNVSLEKLYEIEIMKYSRILNEFLYSYLDVLVGVVSHPISPLADASTPKTPESWVDIHIRAIIAYLPSLELYTLEGKFYNAVETVTQTYASCSFKPNYLMAAFMIAGLFFTLTVVASFLCINKLGLYGSFVITTFGLSIFWFSSLWATFYVWTNNYFYTTSYGKWFYLTPTTEVGFDFQFDNLSMSFALLVLSIAFFINIYTFAYFRYEPNVTRLILFIDVFVVSMVLLVTAGNVIIMYLGWEMIGITSFFLINFWATRVGTLKASFKAFTFNKVSDCCILFGLILIYQMMGEVNIVTFNETISSYMQADFNTVHNKYPAIHSLTYLFMVAAFIKSAQFGFHIWLPDSMEAPVPASALIHSATLVSAGIFLILRFYPLFEISPFARSYIIFFGSLTALFGGICSIFQTDVKRLLAYSTISHCGVLMFLTFFKNPDLVIIYLYIHGFFKAIIFMCMGHVIRFANNYQDMRRMGGFYKYLPFEACISFIALSNLGGVSFTWGYYMKHFLFIDSSPECTFNLFCFCMVVLGSLCGIIYSYKLYYYVFFDFKKARKHVYMRIPNNLNKNRYYTNSSLASNIAISGLTLVAYVLCGYLVFKYLHDHNVHFDWSYFSNYKNNLKNFNTEFFLNFYFYINWFIVLLMTFVLFNNWKNKTEQSFKIKFFTFIWTFVFFFYIFYSILTV